MTLEGYYPNWASGRRDVIGLKILIDVLTPKQCMLFSKLSEELERRGHEVHKTTRRYREVLELLQLKGITATVVGEHGGKELSNKLRSSAKRILDLTAVFEDEKPDLAISFSSPEMARASFGLGVPHVCVNDSPHAEAVARLTIPLSEKLLSPSMIPKSAWRIYGVLPEKIIQYHALDPWAWLKDFKPNKHVLRQLGLDDSRPIVTFRQEETYAAYLLGKTSEEKWIVSIIKKLLETREGVQVVALARYEEQVSRLKKVFGDEVSVPSFVIDGPSLLSCTSLFVGAGGTMSAESALLGVPTISCYPSESFYVEKYLVREKLVVRETDPGKLFKKIVKMLDNIEDVRKARSQRAKILVNSFEDPIKVIADEIDKFD